MLISSETRPFLGMEDDAVRRVDVRFFFVLDFHKKQDGDEVKVTKGNLTALGRQ